MKLKLIVFCVCLSSLSFSKTIFVKSHLPKGKDVKTETDIILNFSNNLENIYSLEGNIDINPNVDCKWRRVSKSSLSCSPKEPLILNTRYKVKLSKIETKKIKVASHEFEFSTEGIEVKSLYMSKWEGPELPVYIPRFNLDVSKASLKKSAIFVSEKNDEEVGVNVDLRCMGNLKNARKEDVARKSWCISPNEKLKPNKIYYLLIRNNLISPIGNIVSTGERLKLKFFKTWPKFEVKSLACHEGYFIKEPKFTKNNVICDPEKNIKIKSTSPISEYNLKSLEFMPTLSAGIKDYDPWKYIKKGDYDSESSSSNISEKEKEVYRYVTIPGKFVPQEQYSIVGTVEDIFGRKSKVNLKFSTGDLSRGVKLPYRSVVIEQDIENDYPIYTRNLDNFRIKGELITIGDSKQISEEYKVEVLNKFYAVPFRSEDLFDGNKGFFKGKLSYLDKDKKENIKKLSFQKTNLNIVAKRDSQNIFVFLFDLRANRIVSGADIRLYRSVEDVKKDDYLLKGKTDSKGVAVFNIDIKERDLVLVARKDKDIAFLETEQSKYSWGSLRRKSVYSAWGLTPQGLYKAGDKIDFKIWVRQLDKNNLTLDLDKKMKLEVKDPRGKVIYLKDNIKVNDFGSFSGSFDTKDDYVSGEYDFIISMDDERYYPMSVVVTDFQPSSYEVKLKSKESKNKFNYSLSAKMYSGGSFSGADSRIKLRFVPGEFDVQGSTLSPFKFGKDESKEKVFFQKELKLDRNGASNISISKSLVEGKYGKIISEGSVKDVNGKYISDYKSENYSEYEKYLGIKKDKWVYSEGDKVKLTGVVVNSEGAIDKTGKLKFILLKKKVKKVKVKSSGNVFKSKNKIIWDKVKSCKASIDNGRANCSFEVSSVGEYKVVVESKKSHMPSEINFYVSGYSWVTWEESDDQLDIELSKPSYRVGEELVAVVKNPFKEAKALITIESGGVIDYFIKDVKKSVYDLRLKIKDKYKPGFRLSVALFSPRIGKSKGFGKLDLAKPSMRYGSEVVKVENIYNDLKLSLSLDKVEYQPSDKVNLKITSDSNDKLELALLVVDKSVLDLIPNVDKKYDISDGFSYVYKYDVESFALIKNLIGRQKFEKKGANQGGDGSNNKNDDNVRGKTKYLAYWNPSVIINKESTVSFQLPSNKTRWKIIAIGNKSGDSFGKNSIEFIAGKKVETLLYSPDYGYVGDKINIKSKYFNKIKMDIKADVLLAAGDKSKNKNITIKKDASHIESIDHEIVKGSNIVIRSKINYKNYIDVEMKELEVKNKNDYSYYSQFFNLSNVKEIDLPIPNSKKNESVSLILNYMTSILGRTHYIFRSMRDYQYNCWEQKISRSVVASYHKEFKELLPISSRWNESEEFIEDILSQADKYQKDDGGFSYYPSFASSIYLSGYTLFAFSLLDKNEVSIRNEIIDKLISYCLTKLKDPEIDVDDIGPMLLGLYRLNKLNGSEFLRYKNLLSYSNHFTKSIYLRISNGLFDDNKFSKDILNDFAKGVFVDEYNMSFTSSKFGVMGSKLRNNCVSLYGFLNTNNKILDKTFVSNSVTKLTNYIISSLENWLDPQSSAFCIAALAEYRDQYESEGTNNKLNLSYAGKNMSIKENENVDLNFLNNEKIKIEDGSDGYIDVSLRYVDRDYGAKLIDRGFVVKKQISRIKNDKASSANKVNVESGDVLRIDMIIESRSDHRFVVLSDYLPGGFSAVNELLRTSISIDKRWRESSYKNSFLEIKENLQVPDYYKDIRSDRIDFYMNNLPRGKYYISYFVQATSAGIYYLKPTKVLKMYNKNVSGYNEASTIKIK